MVIFLNQNFGHRCRASKAAAADTFSPVVDRKTLASKTT